jgi:hypothetical protein
MMPQVTRNARWAHQANIERYRKILKTHLTETERQFIERRLAEEQQALRQIIEVGTLEPQTKQFEIIDQ